MEIPKISPQTEDYFGNVNPNGVRSVYDEGKRFGEAITMAILENLTWTQELLGFLILMDR